MKTLYRTLFCIGLLFVLGCSSPLAQDKDPYYTLDKSSDKELRELANRVDTSCTEDSQCILRSSGYYDPESCDCTGGNDYAEDNVFAVNKNSKFRCVKKEKYGSCFALFSSENTDKYEARCIENQCVKANVEIEESAQ